MGHTLQVNDQLTDVSTTKLYPLGYEITEPAGSDDAGPRTWVYVYNDEASTAFAQGDVIGRDAGTTTFDGVLIPTSSSPARALGVAQHAIAAGSYGWILKRGLGEVKADDSTAISANTALTVGTGSTAGRAQDVAAVTGDSFAFATEAAAVDTLATCYIMC